MDVRIRETQSQAPPMRMYGMDDEQSLKAEVASDHSHVRAHEFGLYCQGFWPAGGVLLPGVLVWSAALCQALSCQPVSRLAGSLVHSFWGLTGQLPFLLESTLERMRQQ